MLRFKLWFLVFLFPVGLVLVLLGLFFAWVVGDSGSGSWLLMAGGVVWAVLLAVGLVWVMRVKFRIWRDASSY